MLIRHLVFRVRLWWIEMAISTLIDQRERVVADLEWAYLERSALIQDGAHKALWP